MEENEDRIADLTRGYGLTSDEATILDHLIEAADLYADLPDNYDKDIHAWMEYQQSMARMLMWRVVRRDHPVGWIAIGEQEDRALPAEGEEEEPIP